MTSFFQPARVIEDASLPDLPSGYVLGVVTEGLWTGRLVISGQAHIGPVDSPQARLTEVRYAWMLHADKKNSTAQSWPACVELFREMEEQP